MATAAASSAAPAASGQKGPQTAVATSTNAAAKDLKVTLYWLNQSRSQRIVWLLEELGVAYDIQIFKRGADMLAPTALQRVHPLGKSPTLRIEGAGLAAPLVLAESGFMTEYLVEHVGAHLRPTQWQAGREGQVGGETAAWLRYRYYLHYAEGSLMPPLLILMITEKVRQGPWLLRWLLNVIADRMAEPFLGIAHQHMAFLETELESAPDGGPYLCGATLSAADILMSFPLLAGGQKVGVTPQKYPKLHAYIERLGSSEGYLRAEKRVEEVTGEKMEPMDF